MNKEWKNHIFVFFTIWFKMSIGRKLFMFRKFWKDVNRTSGSAYKIATDLKSEELGYYYFLFKEFEVSSGKSQPLISRFDEDGIPINKTYVDVVDKDYVYFPISIGQLGLSVFHSYLESGSEGDKQRFLRFAEWFRKNAEYDEKAGAVWPTDVPLPQYRNPGPWRSAFSQARAINILLRGWQLTGRQDYRDLAEKALVSFSITASEGGVTSMTKWGPFYEEYTAGVPTMVLNGMIFSMFGLYDFVRAVPDNMLARSLFDKGVDTLLQVMPEYDLGYWSRYNLCESPWYPEVDPATIGYQHLHIVQLKVMAEISGHSEFLEWAELFKKQIKLPNIIKAYFRKYRALKKLNRL